VGAPPRAASSSAEFLNAGRSLPTWVTGLAFISANLGAQEVIGMGASGAKYGIATAHFYWIGAIPAMLFVGLFMMPFYYGSRARSVPEYLKLRFDEKTRTLNAASFAVMTVFSSGISMYAMGKLFNLLLGWSFDVSVLVSAVIVLAYVLLGGLTSAIYNEVLQFFLIVFGFAPLVSSGCARWAGGRAHGAPRRGVDVARVRPRRLHHALARHGERGHQPDRRRRPSGSSPGSASCSRSATGAPTSSSCSAPWPPTR
jgi:SSS family solute:Na+ symporter